jgi:hypothetical protein
MFDSRRKVLVRRLQWLLVAPLGALVLTALILGAEWLAIESDTFGIDGSLIDAVQKGAGAALKAAGLGAYYIPRWLLIVVIAYPFALVLWSRNLADKLRERLFPIYDDSRFRRVTRTMPEIGAAQAMPWAKGSRLDAIATDLLKALRDPAQVGSDAVAWYLPWRRAKPPLAFDHLVIAGRPGAGKSRLIHRLARELGRRDVLGNGGRERPGNAAAAISLERGETRRRRWWFKPRWPQDPWDSGILPHSMPESFATWRPARPTLLWLDDPAAHRAADWIIRLREFSAQYRFPVRLAVVGQSALDGLPRSQHFEPVMLARHTYFTVPDLTGLTRSTGLHHIGEATCERIHALTEGNPLLVELALDFLRQGKPVAELSEDAIIAERVGRIRQALDNAHADFRLSAGKHAVALGTLAGPDCLISSALAQFPGISLSRESLAAAFPSEAQRGVDLAQVMPSVRPLMIGDAFVRSIAADRADLPAMLAAGTFAASPARFLEALGRLGRKPGTLADALCDPALWRSDWPEQFRLRYHQTLIGLALRGCRDGPETAAQVAAQLDGLPAAERAAAEDQLYAWIEAEAAALAARIAASDQRWHADLAAGLTPTEARRAQDQEALEAPAFRFFAGRPLAIFWSMFAARSVGREPVLAWDRKFVESRKGLIARYHKLLSEVDCEHLLEQDLIQFWQQLLPAPPGADSLDLFAVNVELSQGIPAGIERNANLAGTIRKVLASVSWPEGSTVAALLTLQQRIDQGSDADEMLRLTSEAEQVADLIRRDESSSFRGFAGPVVLLCWMSVARETDQNEEIQRQIRFWTDDIIASRFPEIIPGLGLIVVCFALKLLTESRHATPQQRIDLIEQISQIANQMKERGLDPRPALDSLLGALKARCFDLLAEPGACLAHLREMEDIASACATNDVAGVCEQLMVAQRYYAYAVRNDPVQFSEALQQLEAIALRPRFSTDLTIRSNLAGAYSYGVVAFGKQPLQAEKHFWRMYAIANDKELSGPGEAQLERVQATENMAKIFRNDPAKYAEFEGLLRDFVSQVNPGWHQYAEYQQALRRVEQARPFGRNTLG